MGNGPQNHTTRSRTIFQLRILFLWRCLQGSHRSTRRKRSDGFSRPFAEKDMTQILLGQSYFLRFDPKLWEAMQPYPPLGTLYAASYLRQHGYEVALFDAMLAESEKEWAHALDQHKPHYAILYEDNFNYLSKMCLLRMREAAFKMIDMAKARGCTVILCGADATDHHQIYLERGADYC